MSTDPSASAALPSARVGLIIPSVNTFSEPQFNRFAPEGLGIHVARARVAGQWKRPLPEMAGEIASSAQLLSDCAPDLIVFHCTDTSMTQGPQGEGRILDIVRDATGIDAVATSRLVLEALQTLGMKRVALLTPLRDQQGDHRLPRRGRRQGRARRGAQAQAARFRQCHAGAMGGTGAPERRSGRGRRVPVLHQHQQIEAIAEIERDLGKPVVNSNQAVLWGCLRRLKGTLAPLPDMSGLGRLMQHLEPAG